MDFLIPDSTHILIVGAGPVGSATALFLSRQGYRVTLCDAGASVKKICGEGLLPAGWEVVEELGLDAFLTQRAALDTVRYRMNSTSGANQTLEASILRPAFGVARPELMGAFERALGASTVEVHRDTHFRDLRIGSVGVEVDLQDQHHQYTLRADILVGADGLHSKVRRKAGLSDSSPCRHKRWGARCYFRSDELRTGVEVSLGQGLESYLTPLGDGLFGLAFLWSPSDWSRPLPGVGSIHQRLLALMPELESTLPNPRGDFFGEDRAIGPLQQKVLSPLHPSHRIALVGDAAGYLDALTGEGLCLGLRQARGLAQCIGEGRLRHYPALHRLIKRRHHWTVQGLLWLMSQPKLRQVVFDRLLKYPPLFQAIISWNVDERKLSEVFRQIVDSYGTKKYRTM